MKVLLSGGTGFLGRPLASRLVQAGHTVVLLTRNPERVDARLAPGVTAVAFGPGKAPTTAECAGASALINLAGEPVAQRWTAEHKRRMHGSRVETTTALVAFAKELGTVRSFISASAVGFYGTQQGGPLDESAPPGTDFLAQVCREWETAARAAEALSIRTVILRLGVVLHPEGGALKPLLTQFRLGTGGAVGTGAQYVSWIHREDAVALFLFALEQTAASGVLNATAPSPVTNRTFAHALGHALHRPSVFTVPAFILRAALGEMSMVILQGQQVLPKRALELGFTFRFPQLEGALENLLAG